MQSFGEDDLPEWEPIGTAVADSAAQAVQLATGWPFTGPPNRLRASSWASGTEQERAAASAEDRVRHEIETGALRPVVATMLVAITTACVADYPAVERTIADRLGRSLGDEEGARVMVAYIAALYVACCRVAEELLPVSRAAAVRSALQVEIPQLLSTASPRTMSPDEWIGVADAFAEHLAPDPVSTSEFSRSVGELVAGLVTSSGDPELVGRVSVATSSTLMRMRLYEVVGSAL